MNVEELYDKLLELELFTEEELRLIININGFSIDTLDACLYARYGSSVEQFIEELGLEEEEEEELEDEEDWEDEEEE